MHQGAKVAHQVAAIVLGTSVHHHGLAQAVDRLLIPGQHGRVQGNEAWRVITCRELALEPVTLGPKLRQHGVGFFLAQPTLDEALHRAIEFGLGVGHTGLDPGAVTDRITGETLALIVVGLGKSLNHRRVGELGPHPVENGSLYAAKPNASGVLARPALAHSRAAEPDAPFAIAIMHRQPRAADAAFQQAREKVPRLAFLSRG